MIIRLIALRQQTTENNMSKAFTKENDDEPERADIPTECGINYVTPTGFGLLQDELKQLLYGERPKIVETVRWAAGNGDRSENGDYIYGKRRLREIDRRVRYLTKRLDAAKVVDPALQKHLTRVYFGASVTYVEKDGQPVTIKLVGVDEADLSLGKISWLSPVAKALMKTQAGDEVKVKTVKGKVVLRVVDVWYGAKKPSSHSI